MRKFLIPLFVAKSPETSLLPGILILLVIVISGCNPSNIWENESAVLQEQGVELKRRHKNLDARIDSLWDATSDQLEREIPLDFPSVDRDIFINARNADHIRMFMTFQKLDTALQSLVNKAGELDAVLADQVHVLLEEQRQHEVQKNQFLQNVERKNVSASR